MSTPPAEIDIDADAAQDIVASERPDLAGLGIGKRLEGWDNVIFRLGGELAVRVPRRAAAARNHANEVRWANEATAPLTCGVPHIEHAGAANPTAPWGWAVVRWVEGAPGVPRDLLGATELAAQLASLHRPAPEQAPFNPYRSTSLADRRGLFIERLDKLESLADRDATIARYDAGVEVGAPEERTWCHLDLHGGNLAWTESGLGGILDWGDLGAGNPATDFGQFAVGCSRRDASAAADAYWEARGTDLDSGFAARALAEALYYAVTLESFEVPVRVNTRSSQFLGDWGVYVTR